MDKLAEANDDLRRVWEIIEEKVGFIRRNEGQKGEFEVII